jgi:molybdate/tungstate transport system substrate-binding protein
VTQRVTVLHAGAVTDLVTRGIAPALLDGEGIEVVSVPGHSVALASGIINGDLQGDVYLSADARINALLSGPGDGQAASWFLVFARNAVVLAYSLTGPLAKSFERVKAGELPWHEVLCQHGLRLGRNDPNHDPMGYYTVLVCALAEEHYGLPGLRHRLLGDDVNPEQVGRASLTGLADGSLDAMFLYRSAAIGRPFGFIDLPTAINLGDAGRAAFYARAEFRTSDGHVFRGTPISFSATVLRSATSPAAALRFVEFLISPAGLAIVQDFHFISSPILAGGSAEDLPPSLAARVQGAYVAW